MAANNANASGVARLLSRGRSLLRTFRPLPNTGPPKLSEFSTCGVADSAWSSGDFMLGAGMVIIQQKTNKIVVLYDAKYQCHLFPRGRKDRGESIEQTALREAYEESGYRTEFLPLFHPSRQPAAPGNEDAYARPGVEPIFFTIKSCQPKRGDSGGEYMTTWFAGQISEDAVAETGTRMPDEQSYSTHLMTIEDAMKSVWGQEKQVLLYVWNMYVETLRKLDRQAMERQKAERKARPASG